MRCYLFTSSCSVAAILAVVFFGNGALVFGDEEATRRTVTLDVYYESLCPDSIRWFKKQLLPSYDALKDHLALTFVPYGKASYGKNPKNNEWQLTCQHGSAECDGNMAQACAINAIQKEIQGERAQDLTVAVLGCAMTSRYPPSAVPQCARNAGLSDAILNSINDCIQGPLSKELFVENGKKTEKLSPPLSFVPSFTFMGRSMPDIQDDILNHLLKEVCSVLSGPRRPQECDSA